MLKGTACHLAPSPGPSTAAFPIDLPCWTLPFSSKPGLAVSAVLAVPLLYPALTPRLHPDPSFSCLPSCPLLCLVHRVGSLHQATVPTANTQPCLTHLLLPTPPPPPLLLPPPPLTTGTPQPKVPAVLSVPAPTPTRTGQRSQTWPSGGGYRIVLHRGIIVCYSADQSYQTLANRPPYRQEAQEASRGS